MSTGRRKGAWEVQELDASTRVWLTVHTYDGTYQDGQEWYRQHGDDEQVYRVVYAYPPHRVMVAGEERTLEPATDEWGS